jgi:hypothetical protein
MGNIKSEVPTPEGLEVKALILSPRLLGDLGRPRPK